ncbi:MAG: hypothetical protein V1926_05340 [Candidatus Peregrinibacteria bacterium]
MIYLIGGAPRLGKSILATKLLHDRGIPWLSTDSLCAMLRSGTEMQFSDIMHLGTAKIVEREMSESESITKSLGIFIERQLESGLDFTLEGVHLLPTLVGHTQKTRPAEVKSVFVVSTDRKVVLSGLHSDTREQNWMRGASEEMQRSMADFVVGYSVEIKNHAEKEGLPLFERTENFQQDIEAMVRLLQKRG